MSKNKSGESAMHKVAAFIVDKRNIILLLYVAAFIFSLIAQNWVNVCNDLTAYLPADTETRQGLTIMEDEFDSPRADHAQPHNLPPQRRPLLRPSS